MISSKKYLIGLLSLVISSLTYGQDLIKRIPAEADIVAVLNSQAIIKHSSFEKLNEMLSSLGAFAALKPDWQGSISKLEDLDLDFDRNAYAYRTNSDSAYYVGVLIPLKSGHNIEKNILSALSPTTLSDGFQLVTAKDGKTQLAWNENSLLVLTGDYKSHYFRNDSIASAYGIELPNSSYDSVATAFDPATDGMGTFGDENWGAAADSAQASENSILDLSIAAADTAMLIATEMSQDSIAPPAVVTVPAPSIDSAYADWNDYDALADTAVAYEDYYDNQYDAYTDDSYKQEMARHAKNDSLKNSAFAMWVKQVIEKHVLSTNTGLTQKQLGDYDKNNGLLHVWIKDLDNIYRDALPYDELGMGFGINMSNLNYGYQDATLDLIQEKNVLKFKASVGLDKDVQQLFAKMYKSKVNRKFAKYIPENHLGYLSVNVNTEAYLNSIPLFFERWYAPMLFKYTDLINVAGMTFQIALDEKAIGKVMRGDHVIFINDLKKVKTEYVDYEYDEDYNYKEVKKTKEEEIPNFLWMFTSEDQRIFKRLLLFAEKEQHASQSDGIYKIAQKNKSMAIYVLFKDDLVFVGSDSEQLLAIKKNRFKTSRDASVKKQIFANSVTATVHTAQIPDVIKKLGVPLVGSWNKNINSLSEYGDIILKANGMKKKRIEGEFSIAFPQKESNALQYLLQNLIDTFAISYQ